MAKEIIWSATAHEDRKQIFLYWKYRNNSSAYSRKLNFVFNEAVALIARFPKIGKPTGHKDTRIKIVRDYLIVYKEYDTQILIITIWDSRRNPLSLTKLLQ